ncbi:MAG TPA: NYN domain-containing protein [Candidatus Elarobacter sp.]|jgi:uncharacterized LabA/DUF88 family protein
MKVAVFVDAGYLYALGCMARFHAQQPRVRVELDIDAVVRQLKFEVAALDGGGGRLIRIYWYDGVPKSGMTADQARTAASADVKLRLGSVNNYGEQKGVDALIAHDLSELARNGAIDAAILVSGDEDILVGVQTAQTFGVRVHLLGIDPAHSQAQRLRYEADVCHEWPEGLVAPWVSLKPGARVFQAVTADDGGSRAPAWIPDMDPVLTAMQAATAGREHAILASWDRAGRIAREIDSQLMRVLSSVLDRQLSLAEKPALRQAFIDRLRETAGAAAAPSDGLGADETGIDADAADGDPAAHDEASAERDDFEPVMPELAAEQIAEIAAEMLPAIRARLPRIIETWDEHRRLPVDVNVQLLKAARAAAGHEIENRAALRDAFMSALRAAAPADPDAAPADPDAAPADPDAAAAGPEPAADDAVAGEPPAQLEADTPAGR